MLDIKEFNSKNFQRKLKIKYALDRILAYLLCFFLLPFILLIAWVIKLQGWLYPEEGGSVFYTEPRVSAGRVFRIIKFRTVPKSIVQWIRQAQEIRSITYVNKSTRAGKFILRWYLDELPQIFNILKGEISFVGPRPDVIGGYEERIKSGNFYLRIMKGGWFGILQACKRSPKHILLFTRLALLHKSEIDVLNSLEGLYARECIRRSLWGMLIFDFVIMARFLLVFVRGAF